MCRKILLSILVLALGCGLSSAGDAGPADVKYGAAFGPAGGDLAGYYPSPNVAKLDGVTLPAPSGGSPSAPAVLGYTGSALAWATASAAAGSFVYQQGGSAGGNVFTSFAGAVAASNALSGAPTSIFIDASHGSPVVPSGSYNLAGVTLVGLGLQAPVTLTWQNGATVSQPWASVQFLQMASQSASAVMTITNGQSINLGQFSFWGSAEGASPFFIMAAAANATVITSSTVNLGDGFNPIISASAGTVCNVSVNSASVLEPSALTGAGVFNVSVLSSALGSGSQPGVTGTIGFLSPLSPYARGYGVNSGNVYPSSTTPTIIKSVTVTPTATGRFRVIATGTAINGTATAGLSVTVTLSHGAAATPTDVTLSSVVMGTNQIGAGSVVGGVADLDQLGTPVIAPVGTSFQINAVITNSSNAGTLGFPAGDFHLSVQEVP